MCGIPSLRKMKLLVEGKTEFTSKELISDLMGKFGKDFSSQPICHGVCAFVVDRLSKFGIKANKKQASVFYADEPIVIDGHSVILYENVVYDYTPNQYNVYGIPHKEVPVICKTRDGVNYVEGEYRIVIWER